MKSSVMLKLFIIVIVVFLSSCQDKKGDKEKKSKTDISEFLGHWTIDIEGGSVGWLDVRQESGYLDADLLWGGGSVLPVSYIYLNENVLYVGRNIRKVVRQKDTTGVEIRTHMLPAWVETKKEGEKLVGYYLSPKSNGIGLDSTSIVGTKLPEVPAAPSLSALKFGNPIVLLNGKDLSGWKLVEDNKTNGWSIVNGVLVNNPAQKEGEPPVRYGNLKTIQKFDDFNLKLEVNVPAHSNSGVYLRGMYEIQVLDSYGNKLDPHNMGAVYSRICPTVNAEKPAGTWQTLDITLCDRHITVILNGITIINNQPVLGPTGGALTSDVFAPGPIYLQGDHGTVSYRNIVLTPIIK
jgi:hypothetical protein